MRIILPKSVLSLLATTWLGALGLVPGSIAQSPYAPPASNRVDLNFNYDWKFIEQDVAGA